MGHQEGPDVEANDYTPAPAYQYGDEKRNDMRAMVEASLHDTRYNQTQRGLKSRHVQMMALGGTIGTGLFVGSGQALAIGGPAFLVSAYLIIGVLVYLVVTAIAEVGTYLPVHGGTMSYYGFRYVSRSLGFSLGYLYWYSLGILVPNEIVAASLIVGYWNNSINIAVWISIFLVVIIALNLLPVRWYGESEFWFASLKVIMMLGLIILAFILFWGGGPSRQRLGFHYWTHPRPANEYIVKGDAGRFVAFLQCIVLSAFAFLFAPELIIQTAGEMESPRHNIPRASRRFFYRLAFFYILGSLAISVTCPSDEAALTNGGAGAGSSPFVFGIKNAGIAVLPGIVNAVILTSAWSSGNSYLYMSSRALYSLAVAGDAPHIFKACNRYGLPYMALAASALFLPLAYLAVGSGSSRVFNWFVSFTNTSAFISWTCCCIIHFRFTKAVKVQGIELTYKSRFQPWGARIGIFGFIFLLLINGFHTLFPSRFNASDFLTAYIGIPAFLLVYFSHRWYTRSDPWMWRPEDIDMVTGLDEIVAAERPPVVRTGFMKYVSFIYE
ncbi:proline permease PrnB [Arthroderma uncinatum]|uniref:proline permease PrnB n=1 Tax=Arthroderma uncinatum TaxID=74035 RepID=UPI00144AA503|nr:proline permease PrnB [Arthroderma uncinatum]KAF3484415.1 proline permease PrnB [Arthroderma uncinatum]